jgi:ferredoxin-type protein NapH
MVTYLAFTMQYTLLKYLLKGRYKLKRILQGITQIVFLGLFVALVVTGRIQFWLGLVLLGIITALIFNRLYCGWICPINTGMRAVIWIKKRLSIKSIKIPEILTRSWVRYLVLGLFFVTFALAMITGKKLPVLPVLFAAGILLTFFFPEELWHHYLCPYGTLISLTGSRSKYAMKIDQNLCNSCGKCKEVCPAVAVEKDGKRFTINKQDCLVCTDCAVKCKQKAIGYY